MKTATRRIAWTLFALSAAFASLAARPLPQRQATWNPLQVPSTLNVTCPVKYVRTQYTPVRLDRRQYTFEKGTDRLVIEQVGIENDTDVVAHRIWLFWQLYSEADLSKPIASAVDIPTDLRDVDKLISPSVTVNWVFPPSPDGGSYAPNPTDTYRLEIGISKIEWADGTTWVRSEEKQSVPDDAPQQAIEPERAQRRSID